MVRTLLTATAIFVLSTSVPAQITQLCFPGTGGVINCPCPSQALANPAGGCANHGAGATSGAVLNASGTPSVSADMATPALFLTTSNHRIPPTAGILNVFYSYAIADRIVLSVGPSLHAMVTDWRDEESEVFLSEAAPRVAWEDLQDDVLVRGWLGFRAGVGVRF